MSVPPGRIPCVFGVWNFGEAGEELPAPGLSLRCHTGDTKLCPQPARLGGAQGESGVSRTYNFKLKKQCAVYWRCRVSPEREAHKDHITVQAIMQRVYYIYISKCFSKQQPPYEQSRITGSFGVTNDP